MNKYCVYAMVSGLGRVQHVMRLEDRIDAMARLKRAYPGLTIKIEAIRRARK